MKKKLHTAPPAQTGFERVTPDYRAGLTGGQVQARAAAGALNRQDEGLTPSVPKIVLKNTLTLFNLILAFLAVVIALVGRPENTLFLGVAVCNTAMNIFQEIRSKKTLDKLSVLAQSRVRVVRDAKTQLIPQDEVALDDIVLLASGDQIVADGTVLQTNGLECDESLLTGETDRIRKQVGDTVFSGSYVTGGQAYVHVTAVGADNYANALTSEAKQAGKGKSKLLRTLNNIIRVLTVVIIPLGILLYYVNYMRGEFMQSAVLGSASAVIGMIPSGLVLLTGITLTVGALTLASRQALVQSLPSIETLARVDTLCVDKTGTITDGTLTLERIEPQPGATEQRVRQAVMELMGALHDENSTAKALRGALGESRGWPCAAAMPFSSDRKWSGATFQGVGTYLLGAPNILFPGGGQPAVAQANAYAEEGYRVLCLAASAWPLGENGALPHDLRCEALLVLSDTVRADAADTFRYFADEGVTIKVISGDNPRTAGAVAAKAGIARAQYTVDMSEYAEDADFTEIVEEYTVFGHVTPRQKQELLRAMQQNGRTTCMTGDGVNDILAMRQADCSVAMVSGSGAARAACDFVLMSSSFSAMVNVLKEGRRVINNIERVAPIYLVTTIFSILLTVIYLFLPYPYPYAPLQMTPINALTVGIPTFFLALLPNYHRPENRLNANIFEHAFPAALTIVFNTLYIQLAGILFELSGEETSTMTVFMVGVVGFYLLLRVAKPMTKGIRVMLIALLLAFVALFLFFGDYFLLDDLVGRNAFFYLPLAYFSYHVHGFLGDSCGRILRFFQRLGARRREKRAR